MKVASHRQTVALLDSPASTTVLIAARRERDAGRMFIKQAYTRYYDGAIYFIKRRDYFLYEKIIFYRGNCTIIVSEKNDGLY